MTTVQPRQKWRLRPLYLIFALVVISLGAIWWYTHRPDPTARAPSGAGGGGGHHHQFGFGANGNSLPVVVQTAAKGDIHLYLNGLGTVTPFANVTLRTQISGQLMEVNFQEGQMVKKGDILAIIDPRPYQVALEQARGQLQQAESQLKEAQTDLARYVKHSQEDSIALQQVDTQRALVSQYTGLVQTDQAAIDSAQLNLTYCHITAPVSGRVGLRQIDAGNYVTPGDANGLVVLTQVKPITVIFPLPEDDVPQVAARLHSGATLPVDAYDRTQTHKLASGTLSTIDNQVDTATGTFRLRAVFANDDEGLFPNQFVNIQFLVDTVHDAIVIPTSAIERGPQGSFVYVVKPDDTVTARTVTPGPAEGERMAITAGLSVGDRVVVDGADKLKEGMSVIVQTPGQTPGQGQGEDRAQGRKKK